jgi:hypothetical protein
MQFSRSIEGRGSHQHRYEGRVGSRWSLAAALVCAGVASACSSGTDNPPAPSTTATDAGDGGSNNATWSDLYRDYFGPNGAASCSAQSTCHGSAAGDGAVGSHFICATDKAACFASLTAAKLVDPTLSVDQDPLILVLRHRADGSVTGTMPMAPEFVFEDADMARIIAWVTAGAKND